MGTAASWWPQQGGVMASGDVHMLFLLWIPWAAVGDGKQRVSLLC